MLAEGARRVEEAGVDTITFVEDAAEQFVVTTKDTFDAVTIGWGFHWIADHAELLRKLGDVVRECGAVVIIGDPYVAGVGDPPGAPYWSDEVDVALARYLADSREPERPVAPRASYRDLLLASPFAGVQEVIHSYETYEPDTLDAALGFRYSLAGVLDRLGERRAAFEREVHAVAPSVDISRRVLHHDRALVGRRTSLK